MPPDTPAGQGARFWIPALQPDALRLTAAPASIAAQASLRITLSDLSDAIIRQADDGVHIVWHVDGVDHQIWLDGPLASEPADFILIQPLDGLFELRAHAARRFWRAINGRPPGRPLRPLPVQTRNRHILTLRALDARLSGESYRSIAEVLFGFRGRTKNDWEVSSLKNRVRRLIADGLSYVRGDYRDLLTYPIKLKRPR